MEEFAEAGCVREAGTDVLGGGEHGEGEEARD